MHVRKFINCFTAYINFDTKHRLNHRLKDIACENVITMFRTPFSYELLKFGIKSNFGTEVI